MSSPRCTSKDNGNAAGIGGGTMTMPISFFESINDGSTGTIWQSTQSFECRFQTHTHTVLKGTPDSDSKTCAAVKRSPSVPAKNPDPQLSSPTSVGSATVGGRITAREGYIHSGLNVSTADIPFFLSVA